MKGFSDLWVPPRYFQNFHLFYQYQEDKILNVRKFSIIIYVLTIPICHMYLYLLYYLAWKEYHHTKSHRCVQRRGRVEDKSRYHHRHHHHCSVCLHVWRLLRKFNILNDFLLLLLFSAISYILQTVQTCWCLSTPWYRQIISFILKWEWVGKMDGWSSQLVPLWYCKGTVTSSN